MLSPEEHSPGGAPGLMPTTAELADGEQEAGIARQTPAVAATPYLVIRPRSGWAALDLRELWHYRDLLLTLAIRDVKLRYKQTALGVAWVILQPLLAAAIFTFVFGKVAKLPSDGLPYFIFAYAGMLGWNAFNSTLTKASACIVGNNQLVSKVYFPRLILPLSTILSTLIDFLVGLSLMVVLSVLYHVVPGPGVLLLPLWLALLIMLAVGIGTYSAALMVPYRDLQYVIPILLQFLLYASPVAYSVAAVPARLRTYFFFNPLSSLLEAFRWSLLGTGHLDGIAIAWSVASSIAVFMLAAFAFRKMERTFADVI
jgi:lipopolysaccharide transport system permease protein